MKKFLHFLCPYYWAQLWGKPVKQLTPPHSQQFLLDFKDIASGNLPDQYESNRAELLKFSDWVQNFLCEPNDSLGRSGATCPYVARSIQLGLFKVVVIDRWQHASDFIGQVVKQYKPIFSDLSYLAGKNAIYSTITIMFPGMAQEECYNLIEETQRKLKSEFVKEGIMVGQFHPTCDEPGLRNSEFRPLRSPVPTLVIRNMVETDCPFLLKNESFISAYKKRFGEEKFLKMSQMFILN